MPLEWGRHQASRPEPHDQRKLGAVQYRVRGHRGLTMAGGALEGPGLGRQRPTPNAAAGRADETLRPALGGQPGGAGRRVGEPSLELEQRARKVGRESLQRGICSLFVLTRPAPVVTTYCAAGPSGISLDRVSSIPYRLEKRIVHDAEEPSAVSEATRGIVGTQGRGAAESVRVLGSAPLFARPWLISTSTCRLA